jgi:protein phosphatase
MELFENPTQLDLPRPGLVVLVGPPAAGKSTLAAHAFSPDAVLSRDAFRRQLCGDVGAFHRDDFITDMMKTIIGIRFEEGLSTVLDATHVFPHHRETWYEIAATYGVPVTVIVLDVPESIRVERNAQRGLKAVPEYICHDLMVEMSRVLSDLTHEPVHQIVRLTTPEAASAFQPRFVAPPSHDLRWLRGPFDLISDCHGCLSELLSLLNKLGYERKSNDTWVHPEGRRPVWVGDLIDRGPDSPGVVSLVAGMVERGLGFCVIGNHDEKLRRYLDGRKIQIGQALQGTIDQFAALPDKEWRLAQAREFLNRLPTHLRFDDGKLVIAHAGLREDLHGQDHAEVRAFALYGAPSKEKDAHGFPVRPDWAPNYRGDAVVVHGHIVVQDVAPVNNVWNIDTGAVFGRRLTALRYPEMLLESVPALQDYWDQYRLEELLPAPSAS